MELDFEIFKVREGFLIIIQSDDFEIQMTVWDVDLAEVKEAVFIFAGFRCTFHHCVFRFEAVTRASSAASDEEMQFMTLKSLIGVAVAAEN